MTVSTVLALHALTTLVQDYYKDAGGTIPGKESVRPHGYERYDSREGIGTTPWI